jgi:hypothetical protein
MVRRQQQYRPRPQVQVLLLLQQQAQQVPAKAKAKTTAGTIGDPLNFESSLLDQASRAEAPGTRKNSSDLWPTSQLVSHAKATSDEILHQASPGSCLTLPYLITYLLHYFTALQLCRFVRLASHPISHYTTTQHNTTALITRPLRPLDSLDNENRRISSAHNAQAQAQAQRRATRSDQADHEYIVCTYLPAYLPT